MAQETLREKMTHIMNPRTRKVGRILCSSVMALGLGYGMYSSIQVRKHESELRRYNMLLTQEVSEKADTNMNEAITSEEWSWVYMKLGLKYDVHNFQPLTIEQKEQYLLKEGLDLDYIVRSKGIDPSIIRSLKK